MKRARAGGALLWTEMEAGKELNRLSPASRREVRKKKTSERSWKGFLLFGIQAPNRLWFIRCYIGHTQVDVVQIVD